jgi:hypothetical protein
MRHLLYITIVILFVSCQSNEQGKSIKTDSTTVPADTLKKDTLVYVPVQQKFEFTEDRMFDDIARYIAGLPQKENGTLTKLDTNAFYNQYIKVTDQNWADMNTKRLDPMKNWVKTEIGPKIADSLPLLYPFSGPDFLHAQTLFNQTDQLVLMAQENVGRAPDIASMDKTKLNDYLQALERSLGDIYKKSYFITRRMAQDMNFENVNGVIPVLMIFLVRTNHEILTMERVKLNREGKVELQEKIQNDTNKVKLYKGVRFYFRENGTDRVKELVYWQCDLSDNGFANHPEMNEYIKQMGDFNTFVKSASYLMHYKFFSTIRQHLLNQAKSVLQDDTGISVSFFDQKKWKFHLYGKYAKPVADFKGVDQPDLDSLYRTHDYVKELPFSLGYHWGTRFQNYALFTKIQ